MKLSGSDDVIIGDEDFLTKKLVNQKLSKNSFRGVLHQYSVVFPLDMRIQCIFLNGDEISENFCQLGIFFFDKFYPLVRTGVFVVRVIL